MNTLEKLEKLIYEGFKDTDKKIWKLSQQTDRKIEETERILTEKFLETQKIVDNLSTRWGRFVEGLVIPAAEHIFDEHGFPIKQVSPRSKAKYNGDSMEIDVLAVGDDFVILIEVKSRFGIEDVNEHLDNITKFRTFFPQYNDYKLFGAVAAIEFDEGVDRYAYKKGLFVIGQSGETVKIYNDEKFSPKMW